MRCKILLVFLAFSVLLGSYFVASAEDGVGSDFDWQQYLHHYEYEGRDKIAVVYLPSDWAHLSLYYDGSFETGSNVSVDVSSYDQVDLEVFPFGHNRLLTDTVPEGSTLYVDVSCSVVDGADYSPELTSVSVYGKYFLNDETDVEYYSSDVSGALDSFSLQLSAGLDIYQSEPEVDSLPEDLVSMYPYFNCAIDAFYGHLEFTITNVYLKIRLKDGLVNDQTVPIFKFEESFNDFVDRLPTPQIPPLVSASGESFSVVEGQLFEFTSGAGGMLSATFDPGIAFLASIQTSFLACGSMVTSLLNFTEFSGIAYISLSLGIVGFIFNIASLLVGKFNGSNRPDGYGKRR